MDLDLSGRRALVTGSTAGIGAAIARRLAAEGATVVVHGRSAAKAEAMGRAIADAGGSAVYVIGDLRTDGAPPRTSSAGPRRWWAESTSWSTTPEPTACGRGSRPRPKPGGSTSKPTS